MERGIGRKEGGGGKVESRRTKVSDKGKGE